MFDCNLKSVRNINVIVTFFNLQNKTNTFYCGFSVLLNPLRDNRKTGTECKYGTSFIRDAASM